MTNISTTTKNTWCPGCFQIQKSYKLMNLHNNNLSPQYDFGNAGFPFLLGVIQCPKK